MEYLEFLGMVEGTQKQPPKSQPLANVARMGPKAVCRIGRTFAAIWGRLIFLQTSV